MRSMKKNKMSEKDKKIYKKFFAAAAIFILIAAAIIVLYENFPQYNKIFAVALMADMVAAVIILIKLLGSTSEGREFAKREEAQRRDPRFRKMNGIAISILAVLYVLVRWVFPAGSILSFFAVILLACVIIAWCVMSVILNKKK